MPATSADAHPTPGAPRTSDDDRRISAAIGLARSLLEEAELLVSTSERRRRRRIAALVADEASRAFLLELTDQVLRIRTARRAARQLAALVATYPEPAMAGPFDRLALHAAAKLAGVAPRPVVALASARLRHELRGLVLPAEAPLLRRHVRRRSKEGMRVNVNLLGEAVLGEHQAAERARMIVSLLERPEIDCVSVKLSALYSQLDVVAYDQSLDEVCRRLRPILSVAARARPKKLVNLDMEEYRDLHLTVDAFCRVLNEAQFTDLTAGIALQAYLPDSVAVLEELCAFAQRRVALGGAAVRVRLVKGANLAMERVEAELAGWEQAPFETKEEVDANYKRLLDIALRPECRGAVRVGVATHNLFDVAWALMLDEDLGGGRVEVEMLEGMAPSLSKAVARRAGALLLYTPVVRHGDFESAVAYLVRRFDENTAPENFLTALASLSDGDAFDAQRVRFEQAVRERHLPAGPPRRCAALGSGGSSSHRRRRRDATPFTNSSASDFALSESRRALEAAMDVLRGPIEAPVHALVGGEHLDRPLTGVGIDPSAPSEAFYRYVEADMATVDRAVRTAVRAAQAWAALAPQDRRTLLYRVASVMEEQRATAIAVMMRDTGKVVREADAEVSEAVDYARYYGDRAAELANRHGHAMRFVPYGVVVVASPWNFPYAIPSGGVFSALAAGNAVILKPAPESVLTASLIVKACHDAGIPHDVVQFVPTADGPTGRRLVTHPDVGAVILTGAFDTARMFLEWRPDLALHAETSGKNAIVVTSAADEEDAVRDVVHSAFSHAGQKCSAASLLILDAPLYDRGRFLERLRDAVESLRVGAATDLSTTVGPLIRPPQGALLRQLTTLGPGEQWLVQPHQVGANPHLWSPGVKVGVRPMSELHLVECFGPVLGVMRARTLEEAVALQNATPYGLTGGIWSLDARDISWWEEHVEVGNAYVNRPITGAVVQRQPFGGWKRSVVGSGAKTGGPNYVASLGHWERTTTSDIEVERRAARSEAARMLVGIDPSGLAAESNVFRLRPLARGVLRIATLPDADALAVSLAVAHDLGVRLQVSLDQRAADGALGAIATAATRAELDVEPVIEDDGELLERLHTQGVDRVRLVGAAPVLRLALLDAGIAVDVEPLLAAGTYELLRWTREQAVSTTLHRHGNIVWPRPVTQR